MKTVEIIVPAFNEEESLPLFYYTVKNLVDGIKNTKFTFIFVDDGSSDNTLSLLKDMAMKDAAVKYISFSRNFGKEAAIFAGLSNSSANYVILMDADLQHPPALIPDMLNAVENENYEACGAKRKSGIMSRIFSSVNNKMSQVKLEKGATDYMCMSRKFVDAVLKLSETQRFSKGLFAWVGFKIKWFDYVQNPRETGKSKWKLGKLFSYAMDGITGFSVVPLKIVTWMGAIFCLLAVIYIIVTLIKTWVNGIDVPGYVTTLVVMLFLGGIILLSIGILGDYIGRIYLETKNRPLYIADQTNLKTKKIKVDVRAANINNDVAHAPKQSETPKKEKQPKNPKQPKQSKTVEAPKLENQTETAETEKKKPRSRPKRRKKTSGTAENNAVTTENNSGAVMEKQ